jgi:hypothetical protein
MTPDQRLGVWATQSAANAGEIVHWINDRSAALQICAGSLTETAHALSSKAAKLAAAALEPPCIAVLGSWTASGRSVVHALTSPYDRAIMAHFEGLTQSFDVSRHILPDAAQTPGETRSAIVRYTVAHDTGRSIPGYPVRVALLAATGVIKILTGIYQASPAAHGADTGFALALQDALATARSSVNASSTSSLTADDIRDIRTHLIATYPTAPNLDRLSAAGYWDALTSLGPYLPGPAAQQLLSMLWGRDAGLTSLYAQYDTALSSLGYARDILCPIEALAERDPVSGWFRPHPSSILRSSTIALPINDETERVHVARRHGQVTEISRAVIAALAAHVVVPVRGRDIQFGSGTGFGQRYGGVQPVSHTLMGSQDTSHQTSHRIGAPDVLDCPQPLLDEIAVPDARPSADNDQGDAALIANLQRFAAAKPAYLFRRAVEYHTVTGLIVCAAPGEPADDTMASALGAWVDQTQGATPSQRARHKPALLLAGPELSGNMPDGATAALAHLAQSVQVHDVWFKEWSPGRPFQNVILVPANGVANLSNARAAQAHRAVDAADADMTMTGAGTGASVRYAGGATAAAVFPISGGVPVAAQSAIAHTAGLLRPFLTTITAATKTRQLSQQLTAVRRQLRARMLRFDPGHEPEQLNNWRTETSNTMQAALLRVVDEGRFAQLLSALVPPDEAIEHLIEAHHGLYMGRNGVARGTSGALPAGTRWTPDAQFASAYAAGMADAVLSYWLTAMRRTASAGRLAHDTACPQAVLDHLVDEIGIGTLRTGLAAHLTHTLLPAVSNNHGSPASLRRIAAVASRTIARFLEDLHIADSPLFLASPHFPASQRREADQPAAPPTVAALLPADGTQFANRWCAALDSLIAENIAASPMLRTLIGSDRQLGELLADLASSPTEVET